MRLIQKDRVRQIIFVVLCCIINAVMFSQDSQAAVPSEESRLKTFFSTADHSKFKELQKQFFNGPEVTKACLSCHTEAAKQIQHTLHWTWKAEGGTQDGLGKRYVLNNY